MGRTFGLVIFGIMFLMSMFMLYPETSTVNLTDQGTEKLGSFYVDTDWSGKGTLTNLETDGDIIYPLSTQKGTFESYIIQGEEMDVVDLNIMSDIRDGNITAYLHLYNNSDSINGGDKVVDVNVDSPNFNYTFTDIKDQYDYFKVELKLEENANSNNQRPNVDSIRVNYIENLDRQGLGFDEYAFQVFALFVFIGLGLIGLVREVDA